MQGASFWSADQSCVFLIVHRPIVKRPNLNNPAELGKGSEESPAPEACPAASLITIEPVTCSGEAPARSITSAVIPS